MKKDIVSAIEFDRALEAEQLVNAPVAARAARPAAAAAADGAAAAAATGADDGSDSDDGGDSFASALARKRPAASAPAPPPPHEDVRLLPDEMAEIELREYDALAELPRVLLPNRETGEVPLCVTHHWTDLKLRRPSRYLPIVALANLSSMATAGSTERSFRGVGFVNDLRRVAQKPSTIKRLSYLHNNPEYMPAAREINAVYKQKLVERKARSDRTASGKRALRVDSDDDGSDEDEDDDLEEPPPAFDDDPDVERPLFTFDQFMAGLDMGELMAWAGLRASEGGGGGASTTAGGAEGAGASAPAGGTPAVVVTATPTETPGAGGGASEAGP